MRLVFSRAGVVALLRHLHAYCLVRSLLVVDDAPPVKGVLTGGQIDKHTSLQNLCFERAMEAFVLALGLRVIGT